MEKLNVSLTDAKILYEMGQISQEEYASYIQIKTNQIKEIVAEYERSQATPSVQLQ